MKNSGYRAIAVDLPGYGDSERTAGLSNEDFLRQFMEKVDSGMELLLTSSGIQTPQNVSNHQFYTYR